MTRSVPARPYIVAVLAVLMTAGCARQPDLHHRGGQVETLATELAALNLLEPLSDLNVNVQFGDKRFLCLYGFTTYNPGVPDSQSSVVVKYGQRCLKGTSDVIDGDSHRQMIDKARNYAERYNSELLRRIKSGLVT